MVIFGEFLILCFFSVYFYNYKLKVPAQKVPSAAQKVPSAAQKVPSAAHTLF